MDLDSKALFLEADHKLLERISWIEESKSLQFGDRTVIRALVDNQDALIDTGSLKILKTKDGKHLVDIAGISSQVRGNPVHTAYTDNRSEIIVNNNLEAQNINLEPTGEKIIYMAGHLPL